MNGLARAIFFGKQGELRKRTLQHQLQRASALIINATSVFLKGSIRFFNKNGQILTLCQRN